ncbi:MAG: hypothetical protein V4510_09760 [bacterium]
MATKTTPHTPGPWGCVDTSNHAHDYRLTKPDGSHLPVNAPYNDHSEQRANARLIAAAPETAAERDELAEVLGRVLNECRDFLKKKNYELYREAANRQEVAAIARAEGR